MKGLVWWLRIVGAFYVIQFFMIAFAKAPIRGFGPSGVLELEAGGDPAARFLVDTWTGFGLETLAIGAALLVASRFAHMARALVWTVIAIEFAKGILFDIYMLVRGYELAGFLGWIVIHSIIIVTGWLALRKAKS